MAKRHGQKASSAFQKAADDLRNQAAAVERLKQWAPAAWTRDRNIGEVIEWLAEIDHFLCIEYFEVDDGDDEEWNGWYYSVSGNIDSPWKKQWSGSDGPVVDDVQGPLASAESARQEILDIIRQMADDHQWRTDSATTGALVRAARIRANLTQTAAADAVGPKMSQPQWAMIEAGRTSPTVRTLERVAAVLRCGVADLVGGKGQR